MTGKKEERLNKKEISLNSCIVSLTSQFPFMRPTTGAIALL